MNKLNNLDPLHHMDSNIINELIKYHFSRIRYFTCCREIELFNQKERLLHCNTDEERKVIEYTNQGRYTRAFSRVTLKAKLENRYTSLHEVTSTLEISNRQARDILYNFRDLGAMEFKPKQNEMERRDKTLYFRSAELSLRIFNQYVDYIYNENYDYVIEYLKDAISLMEYKKKLKDYEVTS
tara:strand:- start:157 stop:702 length:546 start_codon:yes stop_codon:yes gene_type:complete